jgi:hypothetical protein
MKKNMSDCATHLIFLPYEIFLFHKRQIILCREMPVNTGISAYQKISSEK